MFGYYGRIINIDVTDYTFRIEWYDEAFAKAYLGGNGFAARQKRTGFEAIVIAGKSTEPAHVYVDESSPQVESAADSWEKTPEKSGRDSACSPWE